MVAHQGGTVAARGNSIPAFRDFIKRSWFGAECDVRVTADKKFVLYHNPVIMNGDEEIYIGSSDLATIREINIISEDGYAEGDRKVPTFEEYLEICKSGDKHCVIEIKGPFSREDIDHLIDIVRDYDYLDKCIFIDFSLEHCKIVRELLPNAKIQWLIAIGQYNDEVLAMMDKYDLDLDINIYEVNQKIVDDAHAHGHLVNLWTCDDAEQAKSLLALGVDYFTTNVLE
jgi:glycerophosphoryl diester phosphodiesterase